MTSKVVCKTSDLIPNSGVCARVEHNGLSRQIALFYLPDLEQAVFALDNWDPIGEANVLSRGIVGDVEGQMVVASPLYKQHFSLSTGQCLEEDTAVPCYPVAIEGDEVVLLS